MSRRSTPEGCDPRLPRQFLRQPGRAAQGSLARVRPNKRIVVADDFDRLDNGLTGTLKIMREIAKIAGKRGRGRVTTQLLRVEFQTSGKTKVAFMATGPIKLNPRV